MNEKLKKAVFCVLVLALAVGGVGVRSAAAQTAAQKSEEFYKNILVMKGQPADLMVPSMQFMEIALGVHCVYCHDDDAQKRELDTKPMKNTARAMIRMVNDINKNTFAGRNVVTCFTCHRGHTSPVEVLPYNGEPARSTAVAPSTMPTVDQLLDRYTAALGGAEALAKIAGRAAKGTVTNYAHLDQVHPERAPTTVTPIDIVAKGPDKRMVVQHNIAGDAVNTYSSTGGWVRAGAAAARDMRTDELDAAKLENAVIAPSQFKTLLTGLRVEGQEMVGEHTAWVVSGRTPTLPSVKLYFDRDTAYLLSVAYRQQSYYCCHAFRIDYDNFYIANGVRMPLQWTVNGPRQAMLVYKLDSVQMSPVEDSRFAKPTAAPAR